MSSRMDPLRHTCSGYNGSDNQQYKHDENGTDFQELDYNREKPFNETLNANAEDYIPNKRLNQVSTSSIHISSPLSNQKYPYDTLQSFSYDQASKQNSYNMFQDIGTPRVGNIITESKTLVKTDPVADAASHGRSFTNEVISNRNNQLNANAEDYIPNTQLNQVKHSISSIPTSNPVSSHKYSYDQASEHNSYNMDSGISTPRDAMKGNITIESKPLVTHDPVADALSHGRSFTSPNEVISNCNKQLNANAEDYIPTKQLKQVKHSTSSILTSNPVSSHKDSYSHVSEHNSYNMDSDISTPRVAIEGNIITESKLLVKPDLVADASSHKRSFTSPNEVTSNCTKQLNANAEDYIPTKQFNQVKHSAASICTSSPVSNQKYPYYQFSEKTGYDTNPDIGTQAVIIEGNIITDNKPLVLTDPVADASSHVRSFTSPNEVISNSNNKLNANAEDYIPNTQLNQVKHLSSSIHTPRPVSNQKYPYYQDSEQKSLNMVVNRSTPAVVIERNIITKSKPLVKPDPVADALRHMRSFNSPNEMISNSINTLNANAEDYIPNKPFNQLKHSTSSIGTSSLVSNLNNPCELHSEQNSYYIVPDGSTPRVGIEGDCNNIITESKLLDTQYPEAAGSVVQGRMIERTLSDNGRKSLTNNESSLTCPKEVFSNNKNYDIDEFPTNINQDEPKLQSTRRLTSVDDTQSLGGALSMRSSSKSMLSLDRMRRVPTQIMNKVVKFLKKTNNNNSDLVMAENQSADVTTSYESSIKSLHKKMDNVTEVMNTAVNENSKTLHVAINKPGHLNANESSDCYYFHNLFSYVATLVSNQTYKKFVAKMLHRFPDSFIEEEIKQLKENSKEKRKDSKIDKYEKRVADFLWQWMRSYAYPEDIEHIEHTLKDALVAVNKKFAGVNLYAVIQNNHHTSAVWLEEKHLHQLSKMFTEEYQSIGFDLGFTRARLQQFQANNPYVVENRNSDMLIEWKNKQNSSVSEHMMKGELIKAFARAGRNDLVKRLDGPI